MIVRDRSDEVAAFVARLIPGCERGFGLCRAIGFLDRSGAIEAGVVYHNWHPESGVIELSAASLHRRWTTKARIRAVFEYPFDQIGCRLAVARIGEHNAPVRRIWRSLGASEYPIPALRSPTEAEVIYTLAAETWRVSKLAR
jgi:RimJ/RimL family protein N-acetyltransferase